MNKYQPPIIQNVPAAPGWYVLQPLTAEDGDIYTGFYREPIILWQVRTEISKRPERETGEYSVMTAVYAVTIHDDYESPLILSPGGQVSRCQDCDYESEEAALAALNVGQGKTRVMPQGDTP